MPRKVWKVGAKWNLQGETTLGYGVLVGRCKRVLPWD